MARRGLPLSPSPLAQVASRSAGCPAAAGGAVRWEPGLGGGGAVHLPQLPALPRLFGEAVALPGFGMARTARGMPRVAAGPVAAGAPRRTGSPGVGKSTKKPIAGSHKGEKCGGTLPPPPCFQALEGARSNSKKTTYCFSVLPGSPPNHGMAKQGLYCRIRGGSGFTVSISAICLFDD